MMRSTCQDRLFRGVGVPGRVGRIPSRLSARGLKGQRKADAVVTAAGAEDGVEQGVGVVFPDSEKLGCNRVIRVADAVWARWPPGRESNP
jgi:hypothetical protein